MPALDTLRTGSPPAPATLAAIAAGAEARDAAPAFPHDAFAALAEAGALLPAPGRAAEWAAVRAVAAADGSVGRLYEGHLNAVERLVLHLPQPRARRAARGRRPRRAAARRLGRRPGSRRGCARAARRGRVGPGRPRAHGEKVFCSGAGGLHAALVTARHPSGGPPWLVLVDLAGVEVDRSWYRASGMRASESHRVVFHGAPALAVLGEPGELVREPWLSGDAIRTAAAWAGMADAAAAFALDDARRPPRARRPARARRRAHRGRDGDDRPLVRPRRRAPRRPPRARARAARGGRRRRRHDPRRGGARAAARARSRPGPRSTARGATSSSSSSSTGSTRILARAGRAAVEARR